MRLLSLFLCLLLLIVPSLAYSREVSDTNCVPDTGCPKDEGPPKCCEPPECEFWNALEEARAMQKIVIEARFQHTTIDEDYESSQKDYAQFSKQVTKEIKKIRKTFPKCKLKPKRSQPPLFSVKGDKVDGEIMDCPIMTYIRKDRTFLPLELPSVLRLSNACEEQVEAKYESAHLGVTYCHLEATSPQDRMRERQERATREMTVLEDQLINYWRVCSIAPDIEVPEIIVKNSVKVLKQFNFTAKWPQKSAQRTSKSSSSR